MSTSDYSGPERRKAPRPVEMLTAETARLRRIEVAARAVVKAHRLGAYDVLKWQELYNALGEEER